MKPQLNIIPKEAGEALVVGSVIYDNPIKIGPFTYFQTAYRVISKKGNSAEVQIIATAVSHSPVSATRLVKAKVRKLEAAKK